MDAVVYYVEKINYETDMSRYGRTIYQTPHETEVKKVGNCIDKAIFGLALAYKYLHIKGRYFIVDTDGDGFTDHSMCSINGKMYNKTEGSYKIIETIEFDQIPYYASTKR